MKAFFSKIWSWIVGHKVVSIIISAVLVAGIACAIVLPITLKHKHDFGTELQANETHHYYVCECGEKKDNEEHVASATYSTNETQHWKDCTVCGYDLMVANHVYDQEVATDTYFVSETDTALTYNKSCVCGAKGTETFTVDKTVATLTINVAGKVYDGQPMVCDYDTNSNGVVDIFWQINNGTVESPSWALMAEGYVPTDAGNYKVTVQVNSSKTHTPILHTVEFNITKKVLNGTFEQNVVYGETTGTGGNTKYDFALGTEYGVVEGEEVYLRVFYQNNNANANNDRELVVSGANRYTDKNYDLSGLTVTSIIEPYTISGLEQDFVYNGETVHSIELPGEMNLPDDNVSMEITFASANVESSPIGVRVLVNSIESNNYTVDNCTANIVAKYLRFEDVYVKNYDGTKFVRFDFNDASKDGVAAEEGVYVKIEALEYDTPENLPLVNAGYYSQADFGLAQFYTSDNLPTDNYAFDDNDFQGGWSGFKLWILDTNPLVIEVTNKMHIEEDYILVSNIRQGSVKVGDSIILPGTPDKVYEVLKIEKLHKVQGQATVGEEVGIYIDGMADLAEVSGGDLLYAQNNIPQLTTTFFASIYAKTQEEGGRQTPFVNGYAPNIVGLAASQQATINIIDVYGKDDTFVYPGDSALVKITLTNALPVSLLENLEFTMIDGGRVTVTGVGVDYVESSNHGNSMVATDNFDTEAGIPMVIRLTNTRSETLDTLQFYVSNGSGGGSYLTDFTIKLYNSSFNLVEGTFNNTEGSFTKSNDSKWNLAAEETCYIVITTTNETADVFAWLS